MLLRRMIDHVKAQNWTAVALDFVIVVVGVFIGIQVSNWNNEREAHRRAAAATERLHLEAEATVAYLQRMVSIFHGSTSARDDVLRQINDGERDAIDPQIAERSVLALLFLPSLSAPRSVYDELISSGLYADIGDAQTRDAINNYYATVHFLEGQTDYGRRLIEDWAVWRHPAMRFEYAPDNPRGVRPVVDYETAFQDAEFLQMLMSGQNMQRALEEWWGETLVAAEAMCRETARFVGRPCAPLEGADG